MTGCSNILSMVAVLLKQASFRRSQSVTFLINRASISDYLKADSGKINPRESLLDLTITITGYALITCKW